MNPIENSVTRITPADRKSFAKEQVQFLRNQGITNNIRLSRIFKVAGPGQIKESWRLAVQADTQAKKDLLDCILTGAGGSQEFDKTRMAAVLQAASFIPPVADSDYVFYRILDGAMEILVPGSYEFSPEELKELEEGLQRSKERYEGKVISNGTA
jgi:hypothetical protein